MLRAGEPAFRDRMRSAAMQQKKVYVKSHYRRGAGRVQGHERVAPHQKVPVKTHWRRGKGLFGLFGPGTRVEAHYRAAPRRRRR